MKYPIGIQSFETIRKGGYVYVDKTDLVYKLAQGHIYFLARPRRFGKSLLCSTLKAYFEGRKDLFEGLKIMDLETEWSQYPVISFDFNGLFKSEGDPLRDYLFSQVKEAERKYDIISEDSNDLGLRFRRLIPAIHEKTGQPVVVLIDEYDKPSAEGVLLRVQGHRRPSALRHAHGYHQILAGVDVQRLQPAGRHLV